MKSAFQKGRLDTTFPVEPFRSAPRLLLKSAALFFENFTFLAAVTLIVFLPLKLALQGLCHTFDIPVNSLTTLFILDGSDLILGALVLPAVIYGLVNRFRTGTLPPIRQALSWGRRQWGRTLWTTFKVEVTVALWSFLLVIPGVVAMLKLAFAPLIVAVEGDDEDAPLERSREITDGHRWRIFFVMLPVGVIELVGSYLLLGHFQRLGYSRVAIAIVDSLLSVGGQFATIAALLMYLGLTGPRK